MAAEIIGVAAQNHTRCQKAALADENIISSLFAILDSTNHRDNVKLKAVFAISCKFKILIGRDRISFSNVISNNFSYYPE